MNPTVLDSPNGVPHLIDHRDRCATCGRWHPDCAGCGEAIFGEIVRDPEQVSWLGTARADVYCSDDCLQNASERYWMAVYRR